MTEVTIGRARDDRVTAIYALCEPDYTPRYVGKTVRYLIDRLKDHRYDAVRKGHLPVHHWIKKRERQGQRLVLRLIEYVRPGDDWAAREAYWIARYRSEYGNLLNLTDGGEGLPGHFKSPELRARISAALRTREQVPCAVCQTPFWRKPSDAAEGNGKFCSRACYATWQRGRPKAVAPHTTAAMINAAAAKKRARTHCKRGHPLSGENLFVTTSGGRGCKECRKLHKKTYRSKADG